MTVYQSIFGDYYPLLTHEVQTICFNHVCITDKEFNQPLIKCIKVEYPNAKLDSRIRSKYHRYHYWENVKDSELLYIDGNVQIINSLLLQRVQELLADNDIVFGKHPCIRGVEDEIIASIPLNKYKGDNFEYTYKNYISKFPELIYEKNIVWTGFIGIKDSTRVRGFMDCVWKEVLLGCTNDQIAIPYVMKLYPDIKYYTLDMGEHLNNNWYKITDWKDE